MPTITLAGATSANIGETITYTGIIGGTEPNLDISNEEVDIYIDDLLLTTVYTDAVGNFSVNVTWGVSAGDHVLKATWNPHTVGIGAVVEAIVTVSLAVSEQLSNPIGRQVYRIGNIDVFAVKTDSWTQPIRVISFNTTTKVVSQLVLPDCEYGNPNEPSFFCDNLSECYLWGNRLVSQNNSMIMRRYRLVIGSNGLPTSATLLEKQSFVRDPLASMMTGPVIRLSSGAVVGYWSEVNFNEAGVPIPGTVPPQSEYYYTMGWAYRSSVGTYSSLIRREACRSYFRSAQLTMAQHPADGSVWSFYQHDALPALNAYRLIETGSGLTFDWHQYRWIYSSVEADRQKEPYGENPAIFAVPDPLRNLIRVLYPNDVWKLVYLTTTEPLVYRIISHMTILGIAANRSTTFSYYNGWQSPMHEPGMTISADGTVHLFCQRVTYTPVPFTPPAGRISGDYAPDYKDGDLVHLVFDGISWSAPQLLINIGDDTSRSPYSYGGAPVQGIPGRGAITCLTKVTSETNKVHLFEVTDA